MVRRLTKAKQAAEKVAQEFEEQGQAGVFNISVRDKDGKRVFQTKHEVPFDEDYSPSGSDLYEDSYYDGVYCSEGEVSDFENWHYDECLDKYAYRHRHNEGKTEEEIRSARRRERDKPDPRSRSWYSGVRGEPPKPSANLVSRRDTEKKSSSDPGTRGRSGYSRHQRRASPERVTSTTKVFRRTHEKTEQDIDDPCFKTS